MAALVMFLKILMNTKTTVKSKSFYTKSDAEFIGTKIKPLIGNKNEKMQTGK